MSRNPEGAMLTLPRPEQMPVDVTGLIERQMPWRARAACIGMDGRLFFVGRGEELDPAVVAACERCTVRDECLDWALRHEHLGYWGGMGERPRRTLRRRLGIRVGES
ncbi:WhiB family transcriptional regulator [Haloactinopolyspora sp.]|uniref:WhiB family transcriptional regulator n=1 Tax=Haloactinopolyspora sp. TaxID=1966353 RepID=UPI00260AD3B0|nr:WhiB family transcriptional regulator [Haloactinopolyspora sp.]